MRRLHERTMDVVLSVANATAGSGPTSVNGARQGASQTKHAQATEQTFLQYKFKEQVREARPEEPNDAAWTEQDEAVDFECTTFEAKAVCKPKAVAASKKKAGL